MSRPIGTDPLVGRVEHRERLAEWVEELVSGTGRAVLIEGETGIGKSSLVRSLAGLVEAAGGQVLWAACEQLSRAFPLFPLLEALRGRDEQPRSSIVATLRGGWAPGTSGDRVAEAVEQLLSALDDLCGPAPVLLVVDDLQWADPATVLTWGRLAHSVNQLPLLLVGTTRPVGPTDDIRALRRLVEPANLMTLDDLAPAEAVELVTALVRGEPGPELLRLAEGAAGNPLYLTELIDALVRGQRLVTTDGRVELTDGPAPESLTAAIADRLAFLSAPAHELVRAAALLGLDFSMAELIVVSGKAVPDLLPALEEAATAGVLKVDGASLSFRHPLIRQALYDAIPAVVRAAWHREVGRALADYGASVEGVARQLLPALDGADPASGAADHWIVGWLVEAGQQLVGQVPQAAIPLLRWAIAGTPAGVVRHDELACRLADVLYRVGDAAGAAQVATRALAQVNDPDLLVDLHWILAQCRVMAGLCEESLAELDTALRTPGLNRIHRARLLVLMARVQRSLGRVERANQVADEALTEATQVGDRWATAWAISVLTMVRSMRGEAAEVLPLFDQALAVAEGEPALADLRLLLQINRANTLGDLDRYDEAISSAREVRRAADRAGNVLRLSQAESLLGELLFDVGQWDEALSEVDSVDHLPGVSKNPVVECYHHGIAATIKFHCGGNGARHLTAAEPYAAQVGKRVIYTLALARSIEREQAGASAHALAELLDALGHSTEEPGETSALLADTVRLALAEGERDAAEVAAARAEMLARSSDAYYRRATAIHCRGLLDDDPVQLVQAAKWYDTATRPLPRAQALEAAAVALVAAGDIPGARANYNEAFAGYTALGASWDMARIQARFRAYGIRRGPATKHRRSEHGWDSLTPAESRIVELVAQGLSNPQIAGQLFLSRRTVQSHVSNILSKLALHSRTDIAREAARRDATRPA